MIRRSRSAEDVLGISETELAGHIRDLDEMHHDESLPALRSSVQQWIEANNDRSGGRPPAGPISRRRVLAGAGAALLGGVVLAACSSSGGANSARANSGGATTTTGTTTGSGGTASLTGDLAVAGLAASLENLGVYAYGAGIKAAGAGKLGKVPPAVVTFATTAMAQHRQHAAAWNAVLTGAGKAPVTETDPVLTPTVNRMFGQVTDVAGLARLALEIENIAAQTYQEGIGVLSSNGAIRTAASIQPVEMQHAAILNLVLGNYPVPNAFNPTSGARPVSDLTGS